MYFAYKQVFLWKTPNYLIILEIKRFSRTIITFIKTKSSSFFKKYNSSKITTKYYLVFSISWRRDVCLKKMLCFRRNHNLLS